MALSLISRSRTCITPICRMSSARSSKLLAVLDDLVIKKENNTEPRAASSRAENPSCSRSIDSGPSSALEHMEKRALAKENDEKGQEKQAQPLYSYKDYEPEATLVLTRDEEEANDLISSLTGPLGFDTEWRVLFSRGSSVQRPTALVQLCDGRTILLMQISDMKGIPEKLKEILQSPSILKIGAKIREDARKLYRDFGLCCSGLIELGALARHADADFGSRYFRIIGKSVRPTQNVIALAKLVSMYELKTLDKGNKWMGNWEGVLDERMKAYAANDAHSAYTVYKTLLSHASKENITLDPACYTFNFTPPSPSSAPEQELEITRASPARPQQLRAYMLWHIERLPLPTICARLRSAENPLKEGTVITYVVEALCADSRLPFDMRRLKELVQMEAYSWARHRLTIASLQESGRGVSSS